MKTTKMPLISAIHHFALDDGPGIRTTVFLKGCPLSCPWCHNPEAISPKVQIAFYAEKCIQCGDCSLACRAGAVSIKKPERIDRTKCSACGKCADACPTLALQRIGTYYPPHLLVEELLRDRIFHETSHGGITFSGGEPTQHMDYLSAVMKLLKQNGVHIALQTAGFFDLNKFTDELLPYLDLIFYDIKFIDSGEHKKWTGKGNKIILANFLKLTEKNKDLIIPRIPLIPGITATKENLVQIAEFIRAAGYDHYELLDYNSAGRAKRLPLGKSIPEAVKFLRWDEKTHERYRKIFADHFTNQNEGISRKGKSRCASLFQSSENIKK
jgi:pyruvate formate lyase activating enzyme